MIRGLQNKLGFKKTFHRSCRTISVHIFQFCNFSERPQQLSAEIRQSSDTFGNFDEVSSMFESTPDDPEDVKEKLRMKAEDRQSSSFYIHTVKNHLNNHEYPKAVALLEERMLKVDRVKPDSYIYDLLISYCGRKGDVKEAFRLYNQIKRRGYHVTGGQYTSLFNACANARRTKFALEVAKKVKEKLFADTLHKVNIKNYNAMLKAFGRHGDLKTSFEIMDIVLERRGRVLDDTYNFLLQACVSDRNSGVRHVLLVWHKMLQNKTDPSVYSFNTVLLAVRDCNLGDPEQLRHVFKTVINEGGTRFLRKIQMVSPITPPQLAIKDKTVQLDNSGTEKSEISSKPALTLSPPNATSLVASSSVTQESHLPNLLSLRPKPVSTVDVNAFTTPYHRLMLFGGVTGFLHAMDEVQVKPNIKTISLLLEIAPSAQHWEEELMAIAKNRNISLDTGFFNMLIKKRSFRNDHSSAKDVLKLMQLNEVQADIITFGVLALGCETFEKGQDLVRSVHEAGYRLNSEILGALVRKATMKGDVLYLRFILSVMKEDSVQPSPKLLVRIADFMDELKTRN